MALNKATIEATYPLPVYNYKVTIASDTLSFSEVSGLHIEYEKTIYKDGFSYLNGYHIIRGQAKEVNITMKRGIVTSRNELFDWIDGKSRKDVTIDLCDELGIPLVRWKVKNALAVKLDAPTFNSGSNESAIESVELIGQSLRIEYL